MSEEWFRVKQSTYICQDKFEAEQNYVQMG